MRIIANNTNDRSLQHIGKAYRITAYCHNSSITHLPYIWNNICISLYAHQEVSKS
ncbi:hypothetical protein V3I05_02900 [Helicobacter mastomyrinus]